MGWKIGSLLFCLVVVGCGGAGKTDPSSPVPTPNAISLTLSQNSHVSVDLQVASPFTAAITSGPSHGTVTLEGATATYRTTNLTYSGSDSFKYKVTDGVSSSSEATVDITITPLASGTFAYTDNFTGHAFDLTGWLSRSSSFGHTSSSAVSFSSDTYNSVLLPSRHFGIYGDNASYAGDSVYTSLFSSLPVDGSGGAMKDWPWKADLIYRPVCGFDATITVRLVANLGQTLLGGILLNYDIEGTGSAQTLTGYQVLVNGGGGSLTLSRFDHANELATAFMDRYPGTVYGTEASVNPVQRGPYKGWSYQNGTWPAGGALGNGQTNKLVAIRYQYDPVTHDTTISYEARHIDGTDDTPGVWDKVVHLTGADSLPPGGGFGIMPLNYHSAGSLNTTDFDVVDYRLQCVVP